MLKESLKGYVKAVNKHTGAELEIDEYIALLERESKDLGISTNEALETDQDFVLIEEEPGLEERTKELLEKQFLTAEELDELLDSDQVEKWENCGNSGKYNGYTWYTVTAIDGEEYSVYAD